MNGSYYKTPVFINDIERDTTNPIIPDNNYSNLEMEQSYIENILRNNIGKKVRVHASFSDSNEWRDRVFVGIIEHAGRDNLIISDKENGKNYLILMVYLDFVEFDEEITYAK
ncbi:MAG: spore coat protein GerQ [Bacilli bacterium]|nr:spore coat protein GerQ [Bacilli bacterium]